MMSSARIGIITIGQSPRSDVLQDFVDALGFQPSFEETGLLDNLSRAEIASLAPCGHGDQTLVTRLRDGTEVKLSEKKAIEMLPRAVKDMEHRDVDSVVLFCTGEFPPVESKVPVLYPSAIVSAVVSAVFSSKKNDDRRLCIIAPAREQFPMLTRKWKNTGCSLLFESVSPYSSSEPEILDCAGRVARLHCDMVVLDCIGYTEKIRKIFVQTTGRPVILPRSLLARVVAEIMAR
jgi:protein AroM